MWRALSTAACIVLLDLSCAAAATVTVNFQAKLDSAGEFGALIGGPRFTLGITPGATQVTGSFQYETNQTATLSSQLGGQTGLYALDNFTVTLPGTVLSFDDVPSGLRVGDNVDYGQGPVDAFGVDTSVLKGGIKYSFYSLVRGSTTLWNSVDLPDVIDFTDFAGANIFGIGAFVFNQQGVPIGGRLITGTITQFEIAATNEVPLPASAILFGTILGLFGLMRRMRKQPRHASRLA